MTIIRLTRLNCITGLPESSETREVSHKCLIKDLKKIILATASELPLFDRKIEILKCNRRPIAGKVDIRNPAYFLLDSTKAIDEFTFFKKRKRGNILSCGEVEYIETYHRREPYLKDINWTDSGIMILCCGKILQIDPTTGAVTHDLVARGSVFFFHPKFALCARHCLYQDYDFELIFPQLYLASDGPYDNLSIQFPMEVAYEDVDCDLAVLRVAEDYSYPHEVFHIVSMQQLPTIMVTQYGDVDLQAAWTEIGPHRNLSFDKCGITKQVSKKVLGFVKGNEFNPADDIADRITFTKEAIFDNSFNLITVEGSLTSGSTGSPYFVPVQQRSAVAMHLSSNNEGDLIISEIVQGCMELLEAKEINQNNGSIDPKIFLRNYGGESYDDVYDYFADDKAEDHSSNSSYFSDLEVLSEYTEAYEEVKQGLVLCKCPGFVRWIRETLKIELNPSIM